MSDFWDRVPLELKREYGHIDVVEFDLKSPCGDCPFRKSAPFHDGVAMSIPGYLDTIQAGTFAHTCHKTDNRQGCDGPRNHDGPVQHCVGSLLMLLKTSEAGQKWPWTQAGLLKGLETGKISEQRFREMIRQAREAVDIFTVEELIDFYADGLERMGAEFDEAETVSAVWEDDGGRTGIPGTMDVSRLQSLSEPE